MVHWALDQFGGSMSMCGRVTRDNIIAITMLKWIRRLVEGYRGPPDFEKFKAYLCDVLNEKNLKADGILAEAATEIL